MNALQQIAQAIEAGEDLTTEQRRAVAEALRLSLFPLAQSRFFERDRLLIETRRSFFVNVSARHAAHEIATGLNRYFSTSWRRDRSAATCPSRIADTVVGAYWRILMEVPRPLSPERIRKTLGHFEMTHANADH